MARLLRRDLPDGVFHVTSHGLGDASIFREDVDRVEFLNVLADVAERFGWTVHAHCLMDTHYHVVIETTSTNLSAGMQRLNGRYAQLFNARHRRRGHLLEGRFRAWVVRNPRHFLATLDYVLQNPVKAGRSSTADDWEWSNVAVVGEQYAQSLSRAERGDRLGQLGR